MRREQLARQLDIGQVAANGRGAFVIGPHRPEQPEPGGDGRGRVGKWRIGCAHVQNGSFSPGSAALGAA